MKINRSKEIFDQAQKIMVGGVNSPVRAFKAVGGSPVIMRRGKGSQLFDVDGNSYTDYCLSWGALILGHNDPDVLRAAKTAVSFGTSFGTSTKPEVEIAEFIVKHVPSIEMVRFVNSGTEATMSAIRLARGFTKRNKIIKFDGCYHGHCDDLLSVSGSGVAFLPASSSQGVPNAHIQGTFSLAYNDTTALQNVIEHNHKDIACVILEPVAGNMGVIAPEKEFLKNLRALTKKYNIVLIFDEVMSGFRTNLGCVQTDFGIIPDMTCLGKIIGGGFPIGAYGGRRDIMRNLAPLGKVYQAGTFSGNPVIMRAGLTVLKNLTPSIYKKLNTQAEKFITDTNNILAQHHTKAHLSGYKSMISLRFRKQAVYNYTDAIAASSGRLYSRLFHHLLKKGIYLPPADLEAFFISTCHSTQHLSILQKNLVEILSFS
ncbi:MAG: glutamate-1-semialdehyde 2,1-aminomutase [Candidatus Omnitrophica bacterium]|nr:glutamate-1-semialdehyde 2,1-aminomutase [Candidatus Omnitrophota bacterium]